jgi:hypothetical protein
MPKIVDYPRTSLKAALELAKAVDDLGGSCTGGMAAERMSRKISGAFSMLISSASKFGLIENKGQKLSTTNLYKDYKLSYTPEEKSQKLREIMLSVQLFQSIYERFSGKELPITHFEKLLIREFSVPNDLGSRVASYFIDGAKESHLIDENNRLIDYSQVLHIGNNDEGNTESINNHTEEIAPKETQKNIKNYFVRITGPNMDSNIELIEPEDMLIVQAMLKKVEKHLKATEENNSND